MSRPSTPRLSGFASGWFFDTQDLVTTVRAVTGWETNLWELMLIGERRINLMRVFNAREGLDAADDQLPTRMAEPLQGGPTDDWRVDTEAWERDRALSWVARAFSAGISPAQFEDTPTLRELVADHRYQQLVLHR